MDALVVRGPAKLKGEVEISGSKNTALPFLFTSLLFDSEIRFENVPRLWDIETTLKILELIGTESQWDKEAGTICLFPKVRLPTAPYEWVRKMRAGILALGPLVAKCGEAKVSLPGGCAIGARPVNYHIDALKLMGVEIEVLEGYIHAKVKSRLKGARIVFPQITVTGTENLLIVATQAEGTTILENAAKEPEVTALGEFLIKAGAKIEGLGTSTITVKGEKLKAPSPLKVPFDRIEAGTLIAASLLTRSELTLLGVDTTKMESVLRVFESMGARFSSESGKLKVIPAEVYSAVELDTEPYPGFPTDMQAQLMVVAVVANGKSVIREKIFENRFMHVAELQRLGAKISVSENEAIVEGPCRLSAAPLMATDLRASASLLLAGLVAEGETTVRRIYHLDRGYQRLDEKLRRLGAEIKRIKD